MLLLPTRIIGIMYIQWPLLVALFLSFFLVGCSRPEEYRVPWMKAGYQTASLIGTGSFGQGQRLSVKKGDTLYALSRRYGVPLRLLIDANNLKPPYHVQHGQNLRVPAARWHIVAPGDTVASIARRYNVTVASLARRNNLRDPYVIRVGQTMMISEGTSRNAVSPVAKPAPSVKSASQKKHVVAKKVIRGSVKKNSQHSSSQKKFFWPVQGKVVGSYGWLGSGRRNDGINIAVPAGTPIKAAGSGVVVYSGKEIKSFGNLLLLKHDRGWMTAYAHASEILVKKGDRVRAGQAIARVGATGRVSSPQLHFEIRRGSQAVDPQKYL